MKKRYYWLKLKEDFFKQLPMKKIRKIAGGDTYTIIYLKMMLQSLSRGGNANYYSFDDDFISNLALEIDEDVDNVKITVNFLIANGLLVEDTEGNQLLTEVPTLICSEQASAQRVREHRARKKMQEAQKALENSKNVTKALPSNTCVTQVKQNGNGDIDIDIEKEKLKEKEKVSKNVNFVTENADFCDFAADAYCLADADNPCLQWEQIVGLTLTAHLAEKIRDLYEEVGAYAYEKALKIACERNKRNFKYIEATARGIAEGNDYEEQRKAEKAKAEQGPTLSEEQKQALAFLRENYARVVL